MRFISQSLKSKLHYAFQDSALALMAESARETYLHVFVFMVEATKRTVKRNLSCCNDFCSITVNQHHLSCRPVFAGPSPLHRHATWEPFRMQSTKHKGYVVLKMLCWLFALRILISCQCVEHENIPTIDANEQVWVYSFVCMRKLGFLFSSKSLVIYYSLKQPLVCSA